MQPCCRYTWRSSRGFVRCTHPADPMDHGNRHTNGPSYVAVGYEAQMPGSYWLALGAEK